MRILYLSDEYPPESVGGSGSIAKRLAEGIGREGHEVFVAAPAPTRSGREQVGNLTIFWLSCGNSWHPYLTGLRNQKVLTQLERICQEIKPDVIHAHNLHWRISYAALGLCRRFTSQVFVTAHDLMFVSYGKVYPSRKDCPDSAEAARACCQSFPHQLREAKWHYVPWRNLIIRRYLKEARKIFAVSDFLRRALEANGIHNCTTLHNGINTQEFVVDAQAVEKFRRSHRIDSKRVVFFGGRIGYAKGLYALLRALGTVYRTHGDLRLIIAAGHGEIGEITVEAKRLGIQQILRPVGWLGAKDLPLAYAASSVVVTPSIYFDPFPTINLEAMASRRPVVGTCFGGTQEIVRDGVTGYVVNPHDTLLFAARLSDLLGNPEKAARFGKAGYERVTRDFSIERHVQEHLRWYSAA